MEKLHSSQPWRKKNQPVVMATSDYARLKDYSEIFAAAASASSIPVLDLSPAEDGFETVDEGGGVGVFRGDVEFSDVFGSSGGGVFAASYEELFAEPKSSKISSRTRWDVLSEQQEKEASDHPVEVYTENHDAHSEMNHYSSFPRHSDDVSSKQFSLSFHRKSRETIDDVIREKTHRDQVVAVPGYSIVDASDPVHESKNKAANNTSTKDYKPDGGQKNIEVPCFSSSTKNFVLNLKADQIPLEPNRASPIDVPKDEKHHSRSYSYHSPSNGDIPLYDVAYLKVSEIGLQTMPFQGPPPSRPPPMLSIKPEHPKVMRTDFRFDVDEGSFLKSKVNNQLHHSSDATKIHTIDESTEGVSSSHDTETDSRSAAAVSIAAITEAMEQAQARLTVAKKLMDRKRDKHHRKVDPSKAMTIEEDGTAYEVELKSCSKPMLMEGNTISECTFVGMEEMKTAGRAPLNREEREQLSSYGKYQHVRKENASNSSEMARKIVEIAGEWKTYKQYYELVRNERLLNTVKDIYIQGYEKKAKEAICSSEEKENGSKDVEQHIQVERKQKSTEVSVCIEKLEKYNEFKCPSMACMEVTNKNIADATMDEFLLEDLASELEGAYSSHLSDEIQKKSDAREDNSNENRVKEPNSVVGSCLYKESEKKSQNSNLDLNLGIANGYCEERELEAVEGDSGCVEYKRKFNLRRVKNNSNKEVKVPNETLFHDIFEKRRLDEFCTFNTTDKSEVDEIKPCNNYDNEARSMKHQCFYDAYRCKIEESDNAAHKDAGLHTSEESNILVENELQERAVQDENGLEKLKAQGKIKNTELELILNSRKRTCCKDCNEKEAREARTALQEDEESMGALKNQEVKKSEFLASAEGVCGKKVSENITEVPVPNKFVENHISSNSDDEAGQLGEIEELDALKVFLSRKEGSLLATAQDATKNSHTEMAENRQHSLCTEVEEHRRKMNVEREMNKEQDTMLEEKEVEKEREKDRIDMERANYEACQQALAEVRERAERIAVERAMTEARQRALTEAREKAVKVALAEKATREAKLTAERAAVARATEEARKRAIEKALAEKAATDARERTVPVRSNKDWMRKDNGTVNFKATHNKDTSEARYKHTSDKIQRNAQSRTAASSANGMYYSDFQNNGGTESKFKCKARQEREQQTAERAAKALAERNMRDILVLREQAERDKLAESLDADVRGWSSGKDGNLRALLSTLHYILGPDSGWQPIPLTDLINESSVKKAYRKATLCVHPDKLQQRGASIPHKYICEKVFDLLQEAWNKFNSEER